MQFKGCTLLNAETAAENKTVQEEVGEKEKVQEEVGEKEKEESRSQKKAEEVVPESNTGAQPAESESKGGGAPKQGPGAPKQGPVFVFVPNPSPSTGLYGLVMALYDIPLPTPDGTDVRAWVSQSLPAVLRRDTCVYVFWCWHHRHRTAQPHRAVYAMPFVWSLLQGTSVVQAQFTYIHTAPSALPPSYASFLA